MNWYIKGVRSGKWHTYIHIHIYTDVYIYIKGPLKVDYDILNGTLKGVLDGILKVYEMVY